MNNFCKCGCGILTRDPKVSFILGHHMRLAKNVAWMKTPQERKKRSERTKALGG